MAQEEEEEEMCRVLAIHNHVVYGSIGNDAFVYPLQLLGFDVDPINTINFSTHPYYNPYVNQVVTGSDMADLYSGLKENNLHHYSYMYTGYTEDIDILLQWCDMATELKKEVPGFKYVCDPIMGDNNDKYPDLPLKSLDIYKNKVLPLADIVTPNQWETEQLSGITIKTEADAIAAIKALHVKGPHTVLLSSTGLGDRGMLVSYASVIRDGKRCSARMSIPKIDAYFIGTGDLFASLWVAWSHRHGDDLLLVCNKVHSTMQAVLNRTIKYAKGKTAPGQRPSYADLELQIVQSKKDIENPDICMKAESLGEEIWNI